MPSDKNFTHFDIKYKPWYDNTNVIHSDIDRNKKNDVYYKMKIIQVFFFSKNYKMMQGRYSVNILN